MKRKIIKLGQATYVMSLPSKWIRENHLVKGDYLECDVDKERVILSTKKIVNKDPDLSLDLRNYNRRTTTIALHQAYRKGFDIIRVRFGSQEQLKTIRKVTKDTLLGFEVVKEEKDNCVLQNIAEPSAEKYQIIVRKMMLLIKEDIGQMAKSTPKGAHEAPKGSENNSKMKPEAAPGALFWTDPFSGREFCLKNAKMCVLLA